MNVSRESAFSALFALLSPLQGSPPSPDQPFVTVSRRLVPFGNCDPGLQPALYQWQDDNDTDQEQDFGLNRWILKAKLWIYAWDADTSIPASTALNNLLDAVDGAIAPEPMGERNTLGGLVLNCWIDGKVIFAENVLGQQSVVVVPVTILTGA